MAITNYVIVYIFINRQEYSNSFLQVAVALKVLPHWPRDVCMKWFVKGSVKLVCDK